MNTPFVYRYSFENAMGTGRLTLLLEATANLGVSTDESGISTIDDLFNIF